MPIDSRLNFINFPWIIWAQSTILLSHCQQPPKNMKKPTNALSKVNDGSTVRIVFKWSYIALQNAPKSAGSVSSTLLMAVPNCCALSVMMAMGNAQTIPHVWVSPWECVRWKIILEWSNHCVPFLQTAVPLQIVISVQNMTMMGTLMLALHVLHTSLQALISPDVLVSTVLHQKVDSTLHLSTKA